MQPESGVLPPTRMGMVNPLPQSKSPLENACERLAVVAPPFAAGKDDADGRTGTTSSGADDDASLPEIAPYASAVSPARNRALASIDEPTAARAPDNDGTYDVGAVGYAVGCA